MFINCTSSSVWVSVTGSNSGHVLSQKSLIFPQDWERCTIQFSQYDTYSVDNGKAVSGITLLSDGHVILSTNLEGDVFTISDNHRHVLFVSNRTDLAHTFWNDSVHSPECTIVPAKSFLVVVGKTTVCTAYSRQMCFLTSPEDISLNNASLTFSVRKDSLYASDVVISQE